MANGSGAVAFTPDNTASFWSAFQLQAVPEPSAYVGAFGLLSLGLGAWLRPRRQSAA